MGGEGDAGLGHAVGAAEVAAFGDGDAEVVVLPVEGVGEEGGEGFGFGEFAGQGIADVGWRRFIGGWGGPWWRRRRRESVRCGKVVWRRLLW